MVSKITPFVVFGLLTSISLYGQSKSAQANSKASHNFSQVLPIQVQDAPSEINRCGSDKRLHFASDLVATVGDPFSQQVGTFLICNGLGVLDYGSRIYWGSGGDDPMSIIGKFQDGRLLATHTFVKDGLVKIAGHVGATCYGPAYGHPSNIAWHDVSCGKGQITVYEGIPLKKLTVTCSAAAACKSVVGGSAVQVKGTVVLEQTSVGIGALVRTLVGIPPGLGATQPYLIIDKGQDSGTFIISIEKVTKPTALMINAYSGGVTLSQTLMVMPALK
ncbi:hypothetical protein [Tunturiibacter lichenicola]|uniref:hypothetical protein n=1 Tax=Tunturiibacter lichenicola TaxID=2051959 RepID=UPI0021B20193|nr:hypothetical protein [Edaphobacter lichenicola]